MGSSSSKSQRRFLQPLVYSPLETGNKLIAKTGRFRHYFGQVSRISEDGDFSLCRQKVPASLSPIGISHVVT